MAFTLASCGEEDAQLLSGETAREIVANLDTVELLADEGDCVGAESAAEQVSEQIAALEGVEPELKRTLERGAARLNEVIVECEEDPTEAIAPAEIPSEDEGEEEEEKPDKKKEKGDKGDADDEGPAEGETGPDTPTSPSLPPQAEGEAKGHEDDGEEGSGKPGGGEAPSGGVSPGSPAEGGED
jgi:hypothetical protein